MGARLRRKASVDLGVYAPEVRKIIQAMKTYGLIVADHGTDMYVSGTMDPAWDNTVRPGVPEPRRRRLRGPAARLEPGDRRRAWAALRKTARGGSARRRFQPFSP